MRLRFLGVLTVAMVAATVARADVIDGAWCHDAHGRMVIQGPSILTPAGTRTQGDYTRHSFAYVVPESDPGAGGRISMRLLSEEAVRVRAAAGTEETWHRCGPSISGLAPTDGPG
jgi:hypothetical protein